MSGPVVGWYQDPDDGSRQRWWDGQAWGDQRRPTVPPVPAAPPPGAMPGATAGGLGGMSKAAEHALLPTDRSGLAIAAGYLGLFALVILPAPIALVVGLLALRDLRNHPEKLGRGRAWFGTIAGALGTLFIVLTFVMG